MVIVHIIRSLDPAEGGPPMIAFRLAAAQAADGHEAHVLYYRTRGAEQQTERAMAPVPHAELVKQHPLPPHSKLERALAWRGRRAVAKLLDERRPDVLHLHNVWDPILLAASDEARRRRIPYLIILNGMLDPWSLSQKSLKKRVALAMGFRRMLDGAAALHVGNADERDLIAPLKLRAPCRTIPNGIFFEEIEPLPARGTFYASRPRLGSRPFVLFLSRLHYKKGLDYLADAFALVARQHPDVQLVVAGPDGGAQKPFEEQIARHGVADRVHLVGPLYGQDKLAALVDAACFCLPSRQEGFSVAITEALACAVPVVITQGCHFPEVAEVGAGFITPLDAQQVADSILRILRDPDARRRMGQAGRDLIESRFTWPKIARRSVEVYQEMLASR